MSIRHETSVVLRQQPLLPAPEEHGRLGRAGRRLKTTIVGLIWFAVGSVVVTYGAALLYANLVRIEVDSAVVTGTVEAVKAPTAGRVISSLRLGSSLDQGEKIFAVQDPEIEQRIALAQVRVERARSELTLKTSQRDSERARRDNFLLATKADIDRTKAQIVAFTSVLRGAQSRLTVAKGLFAKGFVTQIRIDDATDRLALARANVEQTQSQLTQKTNLFAAVTAGRAVDGVEGLGRLADAEAAVARATQEVALDTDELRVLMKRRKEATTFAAEPTKVVRLLKLDGSAVQPGDAVAITERLDDRMIYAFLTQEEVGRISIGDEADVFLPAQKLSAKARVVAVERSGAYLDDVVSRYDWRTARDPGLRHTDRDRTARVTLKFAGAEEEVAKRELGTGTPAFVSFHRHWEGTRMYTAYTSLQTVASRMAKKIASLSASSAKAESK